MKYLILVAFFSLTSFGAFADESINCEFDTGQTLRVNLNQAKSIELLGNLTVDLESSADVYSKDESVYLRAYEPGPTPVFEGSWSRLLSSPTPANGDLIMGTLIIYSQGYPSGLVIDCEYQN